MPSTCRRGHNGDRLRAHRSTGLSVNAPACRPGCRGGQMRIAVMGAGGVGGFYGAKLAEAGHDVVFIARGRHLDAIREHGLSRSEEHTSELQSLMRISYAVFCLKKKKNAKPTTTTTEQ